MDPATSTSAPRLTTGATEQAVDLWREGWKRASRDNLPLGWQEDYLGAIATVHATVLQEYTTLAELVAAYHASPPAVDTVIVQVMSAASGHTLNYGTIEDAAYWLRFQQMRAAGNT